jgi:hypothetical protein
MKRTAYHQQIQRRLRLYMPPTAPPPHLQKIPSFVADALVQAAIQKKEECSISFTPLEEATSVAVTPCYHIFERTAMHEWLSQKKECPCCKAYVSEPYLYELELRK